VLARGERIRRRGKNIPGGDPGNFPNPPILCSVCSNRNLRICVRLMNLIWPRSFVLISVSSVSHFVNAEKWEASWTFGEVKLPHEDSMVNRNQVKRKG